MNLLYNTAIHSYKCLVNVAAGSNPKASKMLKGQAATLSAIAEARQRCAPNGFDIWIHAASLGEFEQARPLIDAIKRHRPDKTVLLSFFSPSGYEVRSNYPGADCVVYLPFDTPSGAREFVRAASPSCAIFVKYEFWGNYLSQLKSAGVPVYLISGIFRSSQSFFRPWGGMMRRMLHCFTHFYVQDEKSRELLAGIGLTNVTIAGDTRFDRVTDVMRDTFDVPALKEWTDASRLTLIAGSSWPADERYYMPWLKAHPEVRAIIAPHEFDERRLGLIKEALGENRSALWSEIRQLETIPQNIHYIIVDCFGMLASLYRYGDIAVIGGGFGAGIHNINEAAVYGMPVFFGPNYKKFREAYGLIDCGGGFTYKNAEEFACHIQTLINDDGALKRASDNAALYIKNNLGASQTILKDLFDIDDD